MSTLRTNAITDVAGTGAPNFPNGLTGTVPAASITTALNATGSAPIYACRAWVNFNGTGTVAIRASGNVSSITDDATGNYTVNFTTAMPDTSYVVVATAGNSIGDGTGNAIFTIANAITSSTANIHTRTSGNSDSDFPSVSVAIFR